MGNPPLSARADSSPTAWGKAPWRLRFLPVCAYYMILILPAIALTFPERALSAITLLREAIAAGN